MHIGADHRSLGSSWQLRVTELRGRCAIALFHGRGRVGVGRRPRRGPDPHRPAAWRVAKVLSLVARSERAVSWKVRSQGCKLFPATSPPRLVRLAPRPCPRPSPHKSASRPLPFLNHSPRDNTKPTPEELLPEEVLARDRRAKRSALTTGSAPRSRITWRRLRAGGVAGATSGEV